MDNKVEKEYDVAKVKFNISDGGRAPKKGIEYDFGTDVYLREDVIIVPSMVESTIVGVGIHTEFDPTEYGMLISLRSSMSKVPISMANHVGVIEGTYRGEIKVPLRNILNTRQVGEVEPVDKVLKWVEESKKITTVPSHKLNDLLHHKVYKELREEFELFGGDNELEVKKLAYMFAQRKLPKGTIYLEKGTRVAQVYLVTKHAIDWVKTDELTKTKRGTGGFGSTN